MQDSYRDFLRQNDLCNTEEFTSLLSARKTMEDFYVSMRQVSEQMAKQVGEVTEKLDSSMQSYSSQLQLKLEKSTKLIQMIQNKLTEEGKQIYNCKCGFEVAGNKEFAAHEKKCKRNNIKAFSRFGNSWRKDQLAIDEKTIKRNINSSQNQVEKEQQAAIETPKKQIQPVGPDQEKQIEQKQSEQSSSSSDQDLPTYFCGSCQFRPQNEQAYIRHLSKHSMMINPHSSHIIMRTKKRFQKKKPYYKLIKMVDKQRQYEKTKFRCPCEPDKYFKHAPFVEHVLKQHMGVTPWRK